MTGRHQSSVPTTATTSGRTQTVAVTRSSAANMRKIERYPAAPARTMPLPRTPRTVREQGNAARYGILTIADIGVLLLAKFLDNVVKMFAS
jgi:hypothetical protein